MQDTRLLSRNPILVAWHFFSGEYLRLSHLIFGASNSCLRSERLPLFLAACAVLDTVHIDTRPILGVMSCPQVTFFIAASGPVPIEYASGVSLSLLRRVFLVRQAPI